MDAEELFAFFERELELPTVSTLVHRKHQIQALARADLVAQAIGHELTRSKLYPLLDQILSNPRSDPSVFLTIGEVLAASNGNGLLSDASLALDLTWKHLLAHEDLPIRNMGLNVLGRISGVFDIKGEAGRAYFEKHVSESVVGDLSRTPYLRTIAGIHYCALARGFLRNEDLERLCRHPVASVRAAVAQVLCNFESINTMSIAAVLLHDKNDAVVSAAIRNDRMLGGILRNNLHTPEQIEDRCSIILTHDAYSVRMESLRSLTALAVGEEFVGNTNVGKIVAKMVLEKAECDEEAIVRIEALKSLSEHQKLLRYIDEPSRVLEIINKSSKLAETDQHARAVLAQALLSMFLAYPAIVSLDNLFDKIVASENDGSVHLALVSALSDLHFLAKSASSVEIIERIYSQAGATPPAAENALNATCWRSTCLILERVPATAALLGMRLWSEEVQGIGFLERSLTHPARTVGLATTEAISEILILWKETDWYSTHLLPAIHRVLAAHKDPTTLHALVTVCERILDFSSQLEDDAEAKLGFKLCGDVSQACLRSRAPAVRSRGVSLAHKLVSFIPDVSQIIATLQRQYDIETDSSVRRDMQCLLASDRLSKT